jgi:fructokinase
MKPYRLGIDLGGTKIEGIVLDSEMKEIFRYRVPTSQEQGYEAILQRIGDLYRQLQTKSGVAEHTLGIGTPGAISHHTGRLKNSNTVCLNGRPFQADLEKILGRRFATQNDANCFAMAEALLGAGGGHRVVFGVIMGTGCGGGLVVDGHVLTGRQGICGEWGHMSIDPQGPVCYCGQRGCVETFISGGGLEKRFLEESNEKLDLKEIVERYRCQDDQAQIFMKRFFRHFGRALANVINILDPDIVVLGGGLSNIDELYTEGVRETAEVIFSDSFETPIVKNQLGDSAGVIGAALIGI